MTTSTSASAEQIELLLQFMQEHQNLARGRLMRNIEGKAVTQQLWTSLTNLLNGVGGAHKTTKQWQKVWADKKYLAKKAAAASNRSAKQTGGGPPSAPELSQSEQRIINILGEGFGLPDTEVVTNPFPSMEASTSVAGLTIHNNSQQRPAFNLADPTASFELQLASSEATEDPLEIVITEAAADPLEIATASSPILNCRQAVNVEASTTPAPAARSTTLATPVAAPSSSRVVTVEATPIRPSAPAARSTASATSVQRRRLRRQALTEDVRTRLFRLEEEKQKEIVKIRLQLEKLTDALTSALIELRRMNNNV